MATLLLELFSEEIPSRMQRGGAEQLQRLVLAGFEKNMLKPSEMKTYVSPRHLAIQCFGLPTIQPDVREEKRGPKIGAPEQALKGFLSSSGLTLDQCEQRDGYYYATIEKKGRAVAEVVKEVCENALTAFVWPKSMKWGAHALQWVRPLHKIVCLLDDKIVPVQFGHLTASNVTHGHRFLAPGEIKISHAEKYEAQLLDAKVMVDFAARRAKIAADIAALALAQKLTLREDEQLLDEVTGLVEHPVPLLCEFDVKFLDLPPEVLISEMKNHQRYFALYGADGALTNRFITVANMVNADGGARVKDGNGRVVRARLADGEFYWEQDRKVKLEDWGKKLSDVVFHAKVGMMDKKVERIEALALGIADAIGFKDIESVRRAARLCKADLTSGMVGEFPELQGIMGRYYARHQGESDIVAEAIYEHYKPQGANDSLPESELGAIISFADKQDSVRELFNAGEKPTGSKDPLALRRAALGMIRIILHYEWDLAISPAADNDEWNFYQDRLRIILQNEGIPQDRIEASLGVKDLGFNPLRVARRARAITTWLKAPAGIETSAAVKRVENMLVAEEKKSETKILRGYFNPENASVEEVNLYQATLQASAAVTANTSDNLNHLITLAAPINLFFENVMINDPDHRESRLSLLAEVKATAARVADFSKLEW